MIEEHEEEQEVKEDDGSAEGEKVPQPAALELDGGENVEAYDVNTPSSETTLVHDDETEALVAEKVH